MGKRAGQKVSIFFFHSQMQKCEVYQDVSAGENILTPE